MPIPEPAPVAPPPITADRLRAAAETIQQALAEGIDLGPKVATTPLVLEHAAALLLDAAVWRECMVEGD